MPDDLRTRIAAVLKARFASSYRPSQDDWLKDADAVIRELGRQDCGCVPIFPKADNGGQTKQYGPAPKITTRKADDE